MKKKIENRFLRFVILTALFLLGMVSFLQAQTTDSRFFQRLAWRGGENALRFEIVIEEEGEGGYRELLREFTGDFFVEVSLPVGKYRFSVIPRDYRDQPGTATEWMNFEVRAVHRPELDDSQTLAFVNRGTASELNISGKNLAPDTDIFLQSDNNKTVSPTDIESQQEGSQVRLLFDNSQLSPGEYELIIRNLNGVEANKKGIIFGNPEQGGSIASAGQGGTNASTGQGGGSAASSGQGTGQGSGSTASGRGTTFRQADPINVFLSAAWMPTILIDGNRDQNLTPASAAVRVGVTSPISTFFNIGLEFAVSLFAFEDEPNKAALQAGTVNANLLAQVWFPDRTKVFTFRGGGGPALSQNRLGSYLNLGASFLWLFQEHFYAEIGLDGANLITNGTLSYIRPWIGVGLKF